MTKKAIHLSRRGDPVTSKMAAAAMVGAPSYESMKLLALRLLEKNNGATTKELEASSETFDDGQIRKRICDLVDENRVHNGEKRECAITGRPALTRWVGPAPSPPAPIDNQGQQSLFENREQD